MKEVLRIIIYIITFFILYFLQVLLFENLKIAGIKPNIFLIAIVIIGLCTTPKKSFAIGVVYGMLIDLLNAKAIGITAICLGILGYVVSNVEKAFSIESKLSLIIFIMAGTVAYELVNYILQFISLETSFEFIRILKIILIETIYNILLTIIFYPLCKKILRIVNDEIQGNRINGYLKRMR